jgi:hypothetical protein
MLALRADKTRLRLRVAALEKRLAAAAPEEEEEGGVSEPHQGMIARAPQGTSKLHGGDDLGEDTKDLVMATLHGQYTSECYKG